MNTNGIIANIFFPLLLGPEITLVTIFEKNNDLMVEHQIKKKLINHDSIWLQDFFSRIMFKTAIDNFKQYISVISPLFRYKQRPN